MLTLNRCAIGWRAGVLLITALLAVQAASAKADMIDLTWAGASGQVNGARFIQYTTDDPAGSGVLQSFVRGQDNGDETAINVLDPLEFDTKPGAFTRSLQISDVPTVSMDGELYAEFILDINEPNSPSGRYLSLDELKLHVEDSGSLSGYPASFGPAVYDLDDGADNWIKLDDTLSAGSGKIDMLALIPRSLFGPDDSKYIYLYFTCGLNESAEGGFEEWAVGGDASVFVPEPATMGLLLYPLVVLALRRKRRR